MLVGLALDEHAFMHVAAVAVVVAVAVPGKRGVGGAGPHTRMLKQTAGPEEELVPKFLKSLPWQAGNVTRKAFS